MIHDVLGTFSYGDIVVGVVAAFLFALVLYIETRP